MGRKAELSTTTNKPEQTRDRHGFRGVPPPPSFSLAGARRRLPVTRDRDCGGPAREHQHLGRLAPAAQSSVGLGSAPWRLRPLPRGQYSGLPNDGLAAQGQPSEATSHSITMSRAETG